MAASSTSNGETNREHQITHRYDSPFFPNEPDHVQAPAALIILNTPITSSNPALDDLSGALGVLWKASSYRVCADGGANRLFEATVQDASRVSNTEYLPDLITGDLDSLFPHVREHYEKKTVPIVRVEDQDYHDLDVSILHPT